MAEIDFIAYGDDCLIRACLQLPDERRLSDYLNEVDSLMLTHAELRAHDDGRIVRLDDLELGLDDVCAVEAPPRRPTDEQRIRTRTARVEIEVGPYRVLGYVHGPTGGDPLQAISRRGPMIPITEATIAYGLAGETRMRDVAVVIINRSRAQLVKPAAYEESRIDKMGLAPVDPHAKDLTHELTVGLGDR